MLFNSYEFVLVFLPATLILFFAVARIDSRAAQLVLLVASFVFYAWWSFDYGLLIVATIALNYSFGRRIQKLYKSLQYADGVHLLLQGAVTYSDLLTDQIVGNRLTKFPRSQSVQHRYLQSTLQGI